MAVSFQAPNILRCLDSAHRDDGGIVPREVWEKPRGDPEVDLQGFQVPVVDSDDVSLDFQGPIHLGHIVHFHEDIVQGLENAPMALIGMMKGEAIGKRLVQVAT